MCCVYISVTRIVGDDGRDELDEIDEEDVEIDDIIWKITVVGDVLEIWCVFYIFSVVSFCSSVCCVGAGLCRSLSALYCAVGPFGFWLLAMLRKRQENEPSSGL